MIQQRIDIKLEIYAEMIGKSKLEAMYDALGIAIAVRQKKINLTKISQQIEKENELARSKQFFEQQRKKRAAEYYLKNKEAIRKKYFDKKLKKVI